MSVTIRPWRSSRYLYRNIHRPPPSISTYLRNARFLSTSQNPLIPKYVQQMQDPSKLFLKRSDIFAQRHLGPSPEEEDEMIQALDPPASSLDDFITSSLPANIRAKQPLTLHEDKPGPRGEFSPGNVGLSEANIKRRLTNLAEQNKVTRSLIGCGYYSSWRPRKVVHDKLPTMNW